MRIGFLEIAGWILLLAGFLLVIVVLILAVNRYVFEAMALSLPSVIVFRGGIGLVRLATAGKIAGSIARQETGQ